MLDKGDNVAAIGVHWCIGVLVTVTSPYGYRVQFKNIIYYEERQKNKL